MRNIDYISLDRGQSFDEQPNGFITMLALLSRTGVFHYQQVDPDGTVRIIRQLRLPDEVFSEETLKSMAGLPITNEHPKEMISPENASEYIVGMASDSPKKVRMPFQGEDEDFIQQKLTFTDPDIIEILKAGDKKELSLGYYCDLEEASGVYKGMQYDCIQRNIRVNHVSLVRRGRAGRECKVLLDGAEQTINLDGEIVNNNIRECRMETFTHEGKEYKVEDTIYALLTSLKDSAEGVSTELEAKSKELGKLEGVCDDLKAQLKAQKDHDDSEKIQALVKARVALETKASSVLGKEVALDSLSDREIKEKVICKLRPDVNLDGKSEDYVEGRFEMTIEDFQAEDSVENEDEKKIAEGKKVEDSLTPAELAEKARRAAWDRDANAWKGDK